MAAITIQSLPQQVPFLAPQGVDPQDVPWLADLVARQAVRLFDPRQLQELVPSVATGPTCVLHTAKLYLQNQEQQGQGQAQAQTLAIAIKQYHRPADLIFEVHQLLITPASQFTNPQLGLVQLGDQGLTCLVMPYHPLGNLRQYIKDQRSNLNALQQMQIIHDIASGLEFLHQRGTQHMNLHSANVLISLQGVALLTDFGRANNRAEVGMPPKPTAAEERVRSLAAVFLAPEVLASNSYSNRSDVYALGMIMFELLTGRVAFENDLNLPGLSTRIMFGRQDTIPLHIKANPGPSYESLIKDCWKLNPSDRPHLNEVKSRLEKLMTEWRLKMQQQQQLLLQQQQQYQQQQQAQYMQAYQPGSAAPPTPPLPEIPPTDKSLGSNMRTSRLPDIAAVRTEERETPTVVTTHIVVSDKQDSTSDSGAKNKSANKPVEAWTIGLASAPLHTQQRDAIPVTSRTLSNGHQRAKSVSPDDLLFSVPLNTVPLTTAIPSSVTSVAGSMPTPALVNPEPSTAKSKSKTAPIVVMHPTPTNGTRHTESISSMSGSTTSPLSGWPLPPTIRTHSDTSVVMSTYASHPTATPAQTPPVPQIHIPARGVSSTAYTPTMAATQSENSTIPPAASAASPTTAISPGALFRSVRDSIIAETGNEANSMVSFFKWGQGTENIPVESHTVKSASASVSIVGKAEDTTFDTGVGAGSRDWNQNARTGQDPKRAKSFMASIESLDLPPHPTLNNPPPLPASSSAPRESALVIPMFPEPPATLHNRRISQMDIRFRPNNLRALGATSPIILERPSSFSSDDSGSAGGGPRSPTRLGVSPQESTNNVAATLGLTARGAYTPITSSEDVPQAQTSNCIYSAARNGDLMELQYFLNSVLHRSLSNGSGNSSHGQSSVHPTGFSSMAALLDEVEPIERLPVLCCAAVARKNKYQALNIVLKAGANVEGKEPRGGNTPLHLICETAPPPVLDSSVMRHREDGGIVESTDESLGVGLVDPKMSQLSLYDLIPMYEDEKAEDEDQDHEEVLKRADEQDDQEQEALERVQEDSESIFSITTNEDGLPLLSTRQQNALGGGGYYHMKNQILMKGGLEDQIRLLILAGSPIDTPNLRGETPMLLLLRHHDCVTALATFLRLGADPTHMAPFGPGTMNSVEVHMDPKTLLTPDSQKKRGSKTLRRSAKNNPLVQQQRLQQQLGADPHHILIMHGAALAHAAYYLQQDCVRYLLEHEIECSDPAQIEQAIVACQQSVAAQVNPPLVSVQSRILRILEQNWRGEIGHRNRVRVAERTLNRKRKPERSNPLLVALAVSTAPTPPPGGPSHLTMMSSRFTSPTSPTHGSSAKPSVLGKTTSQSLGAIPTTHLYAVEGPSGPEIELISQYGFQPDGHAPRFQLTDRSMPLSPTSKAQGGFHHEQWASEGDSPQMGEESDTNDTNKNIFRKFRTISKKAR
ncbi:hypothetical protein EMPS_05438 [Entomortierella parvispora]|uniref:Protein kinase domain-containing protein n=1 Tax=Entomortierella parvispora TaxID=205924 RepID=A0A9P3HAE5_9FUNG|nr:hypothetical protein EMPS_05438 [Entomortierella parvispora]